MDSAAMGEQLTEGLNWATVIVVIATAVISGAVAFAVSRQTNRAEQQRQERAIEASSRSEWFTARLTAYAKVMEEATSFWNSYDAEGRQWDHTFPERHYEHFRTFYASASLLCRDQDSSDRLDDLHEAMGHLRNATRHQAQLDPLTCRDANARVEAAINAFQAQARRDLEA